MIVELLAEIPGYEGFSSELGCEPNHWRRLVTRHCLYGVDLNPLSVHLARLSLWLNSFAREHKLTFLDHHLRCGNSLIGLRSLEELSRIPVRRKDRTGNEEQDGLFDLDRFSRTLNGAAAVTQKITEVDEDDTASQKSMFEEALEATSSLEPLADLFTAYLMDSGFQASDYVDLFECLAKGASVAKTLNPYLPEMLESVGAYRDWHNFYHWPLEFPDVFGAGPGRGFSATVGNPPWDILKPNSQEFFSGYDPKFRSYKKQEANRISSVNDRPYGAIR